MEIEALEIGARAYNVFKSAGIDTVEDLCLLTAQQLLGLGNFGKKSLQDVIQVLEAHSLSLHAEPADRRLVLSCPGDGSRFNLGLSTANRDRDSIARYSLRELRRIQERLYRIAARVGGRTRSQLLDVIVHVGILRQVNEAVLADGAELPGTGQAEGNPESCKP
jgi:Bacterial RNA polymerase, alpha chain C terminal domain